MTDYVNQIGTPGLGGELLNIHGVASTFAMDTSESPEAEQAGWVLIEEAMARVDVLRQRQPLPKPAAGSPMAAVDLRSPLQPMSYHLKTFDMVAIDNLRAISKYIQETKDVPQMALYSMIRSAVESTSSGLWLLGGGSDEKRAFNCLRISYHQNESSVSLAKAFGVPGVDGANTRKRLKVLQQDLKRYRNHDLSGRVSTTDIIANADRVIGHRKQFSGLEVWKSCSNLAHGNGMLMPVLLERKATDVMDEIGQEFYLTSRLTFLGGFFIAAVENLERMDSLYRLECQPRGRKNGG